MKISSWGLLDSANASAAPTSFPPHAAAVVDHEADSGGNIFRADKLNALFLTGFNDTEIVLRESLDRTAPGIRDCDIENYQVHVHG
jgi:hypothetical protein